MAAFSGDRRDKVQFSGLRRAVGALFPALIGLLAAVAPAHADAPTVVVSIKPIHSLVASVMTGVGEPVLLVDGRGSPHGYTLKPSQAASLSDADLVVWIGAGLESYLAAPMQSLVRDDRMLELAALPEIVLLPVREGGVWEPHHHEGDEPADEAHIDDEHTDATDDHAADDHAGDEPAHGHAGYDPHLWLDPHNAIEIARAVARRLIAIDPGHRETYELNLAALTDSIAQLDAATEAALAPVRAVPFIVFHDAFQYFERRYGLAGVGSLLLDPEQGASAARLSAIRERVAAADVVCAFAEPQVDPGLLETAVEGTQVRIAMLDPEGIALEPGPGLYATLIGDLAGTMAACLASAD